jgi:prepilin-type N-terminal cleavage/methylation domain-containing protein
MIRATHNPTDFLRGRGRRGGFTLIEVLATIVLLGIVLPVALRGTTLALAAASHAKHLSEASTLAETKLNELTSTISSGQVSTGPSAGDFPDSPDYRWTSQSVYRDYGLTELTVQVTWNERGQDRTFNVSTYVYSSGVAQ